MSDVDKLVVKVAALIGFLDGAGFLTNERLKEYTSGVEKSLSDILAPLYKVEVEDDR